MSHGQDKKSLKVYHRGDMAKMTRKADLFIRKMEQGMKVTAAYKSAGYSGSVHAAYQLKARLTNPPTAEQARRWIEAYKRARAERMASAATHPKPASCEGCARQEPLHFEHDHETGKFRGWLCRGCNVALGFMRDNPETLDRLAAYLRRNKNTAKAA